MLAGVLLFATAGMQSCLDFDDPGSEAGKNVFETETTRYVGNVDSIPFLNEPTPEGVQAAIDTLQNKYRYFGQCLSGIYMMRGGNYPVTTHTSASTALAPICMHSTSQYLTRTSCMVP